MTNFKDKVVLITGSTSGIGEAAALEFARSQAKLIIHGTNQQRGLQVVEACQQASPSGYKPILVLGDIKDCNTAQELISKTIDAHGRLDVLVNNAGLFKGFTIEHPDAYANYTEMMSVNLDSVVRLTSLAVPYLKQSRGNIVNVSSNLASNCMPGAFAYSSAKAGLTMLTKCLAVDLAPQVRVNSISPGPIASQMCTRSGIEVDLFRNLVASSCLSERVGEPAEVARLILFLASSESAYMTGSDIVIDGGSSIKPSGKLMSASSSKTT